MDILLDFPREKCYTESSKTLNKQLAGRSPEINMTNADCNEDGDVNMKDVLMLRKYLADMIEKLGA